MLYAGIDGGQSSTIAVIGDEDRVLARGSAGPADEIGQADDSTRLRDALEGALAAALRNANLPADAQFEAIVAGVSGYEGRIYGRKPHLPTERLLLLHDAPIAHAGAFGGEPGVVVIVGTGSVAYAIASDGRTKTAGGWGYLFGDEGSAFWIACALTKIAIGVEDRAAPLLKYFGAPTMRELVRAFYVGEISRERFASYAAVALEAGGPLVERVTEAGAACLSNLAHVAILERPCNVAFTGGLMRNASYKEKIYAFARKAEPSCTIVEPMADPAEGALILARHA